MSRILGICGRLKSGKTELAKVCEKNGYKKLYFALPLKQLCADILDISISELNKCKNNNTNIGITINDDICNIIHDETSIPMNVITELCLGKKIENVRQMLQFIGTDLIRTYNSNWHVNRIKDMISDDVNYVFDDVRFPNEKMMIEALGGDCWFVVRPMISNISNHESETSLTWHFFYNNLIINDSTLEPLLFKWENFIQNYDESLKLRNKLFKDILENGSPNIEKNSIADMLFLSKAMYTYIPREYDKEKIKSVTMNNDKSVFITYKDGSIEAVENPLQIEDLKILL